MKLQTRVILAQLPALVVVLLLLVLGGTTVERLAGQGWQVLGDNHRSVVAAQRMTESIERLDSAALFCLAGTCERGAPLVAEFRPRFVAELEVEEGNITEVGEAEVVRGLREAWTAYATAYDGFLAAPPDARTELYFAELYPRFQEVKRGCEQVLAINQDAMVARAEAAEGDARDAQRLWLLASVVGLVAAIGLGAALSARITGPLRALSAAAEQIGEGQLGARLPASPVAELDALSRAFGQMAERLRRYRRAADSELSRTREATQAAIESLVEPVLVLTVKGEIRATNDAARRTLGLDARTRRLDQGDPRLLEAVADAHASVVRDGRPVLPHDFSSVVITGDEGAELAFLTQAVPMHDAVTGELVGVTVLLRDVTRLRRLDELKGNLVHTVAHELRTPLTSLGMALHLAVDERVSGPVEPRLLDLLVAAREDVRRLRALVEDLMDLSRLQAGRVVTRAEPVAVAELLTEVREGVARLAEAEGVRVEVEVAGAVGPVRLDRARVRVALVNLVQNAIRHSPRGAGVTLRALPGAGGVRFEVDDAGPGVPAADRARIFEPFVRGEGETGEGAGLGLHIAREVVRAHGGTIGVERSPAEGARFWIEIPDPA